MEIVLAVLLLFGGYTLGSITADDGDDEAQSTMALPDTSGIANSPPTTQAIRQGEQTRCLSKGTVIYRDLTLSYQKQVGESSDE